LRDSRSSSPPRSRAAGPADKLSLAQGGAPDTSNMVEACPTLHTTATASVAERQ